ncbi:hypothetical protein [Rhodococcus erythropolis]|uniref:hypothetical protein n=1 Tax=Rhodococcus erythropolis TaxID=1833 RepID=UPI00366FFD11
MNILDICVFEDEDDQDAFRIRLNALFAASDRDLTNREVADAIRAKGCKLSEVYLSQLRSGARKNPSNDVLSSLAEYFELPHANLFVTRVSEERDRLRAWNHDAAVIAGLSESNLKRILTLAIGLSESKLLMLETMAMDLAKAEFFSAVERDNAT